MPVKKIDENFQPEFVKKELPSLKQKRSEKKKIVIKKPKERLQKKSPFIGAEDERIRKELKEIYANEDGTMPDMYDFHSRKRSRLVSALAMLLFACIFLGIIAWMGLFVFNPQSHFAENDVILTIAGEEQVMAGQELLYRIRYRNSQNVPLSKVVIQVRYPEGFIVTQTSKSSNNEKQDEWSLGSLNSYDSGYIDIQGRMYGDMNAKQSFRVFLNYYPANFSSEFQKVASLNTEIIDAPIDLSIISPAEAAIGVETEFVVNISKPAEPISNLALIVEPGVGFSKTSSDPESDKGNQYQWILSDLVEDKKISVKGVFNSNDEEKDIAEMVFKMVQWKDSDHQQDPYLIAMTTSSIKLLQTDMSVNLAINGSLKDFNVQPGEVLNTSIALKNVGQSGIDDVSVRLIFETPSFNSQSMLDWKQIADENDGQIIGEQVNDGVRRGIVTWDSRRIKSLRQVKSGESVNIDMNIPIKNTDDVDLTKFIGFQINVIVEVKYGKGAEQKLLSSNQINMIVNSDLALEVRDEMTKNNQNKDAHTITWMLTNNFHELQGIELESDLYGDISWLADGLVVPAGEASYDKTAQKIVWKIDKMPTSIDVLALQFQLVLNKQNPSQTNLASKVKIKAKDTITNQEIILAGDEILLNN